MADDTGKTRQSESTGTAADAPRKPGGETPRKPQIGDTRPAPPSPQGGANSRDGGNGSAANTSGSGGNTGGGGRRRRRRGGRGRGRGGQNKRSANAGSDTASSDSGDNGRDQSGRNDNGNQNRNGGGGGGRNRGGRNRGGGGNSNRKGNSPTPVEALTGDGPVVLDEETLAARRGRERDGKPIGRYLMAVSVKPDATQISVLEGRSLIEHYVSRPADDVTQIHNNIYIGKVQNVLPGMEAAFVDIGTPKNAVLYRGDVAYDPDEVEGKRQPRIEQLLKARQTIVCQVTKNPIAHKGARLTQEISLPGRFVVLMPENSTFGISKRLPDAERKRLRSILDRVKPKQHGVIVRTAAENVTEEEIEADVTRLVKQWDEINRLANNTKAPALLYREPDLAVRVIREEFNKEYRGVVIDDRDLFEEISAYVSSITPALADRVEYYDAEAEKLPLFERYHVHEQLHKALDRKVWLPSGGSLIIEHTEALTVIDVNTGKNVGKSNLEQTVYQNNLEAAVEVARQLRLRDIGGIIVIDFVDMDVKKNREDVIAVFREALARDKTRTQAFDISDLGLVEMTRKRIGEGLLESLSVTCSECEGRGHLLDDKLVDR